MCERYREIAMLLSLFTIFILIQWNYCEAGGPLPVRNEGDFLLEKYNFIETPSRGYFHLFYETSGNTSSLPDNFNQGDVRRNGAARLHLMDYDHPTVVFHKTKATLVINFLRGNTVVFYVINPTTGDLRKTIMGHDRDYEPMIVIQPEFWFAISFLTVELESFALISSIAIPGTKPSDSVVPSRDQLMLDYPQHADAIQFFTRP